jgi:hypothetical protein
MKKITLLFFLLTISLGYSQVAVVLENFSSGITTSNWKVDSGLGSATTETLSPNGLAGKITTSTAAGANPWQNAQLYMQSNRINLSTANKVVTVAVYSTVTFDMLAKLRMADQLQSLLRKLVTTVTDGKHLVLILTLQKMGPLLRMGNMQEYFSFPCGSLVVVLKM